MAKTCSVCFIETSNLTPLFSNNCSETALSKIVKSMKGIKIKKADKPTSVICLTCIEQCISFFKNQQVNNNVSNMAVANLSTSHQPKLFDVIENNCRNVTHLSLDMMIHPLGYFNWIKSLKKLQCLKVNGGVPEGLYEKILAMIPKDIKEIYLLINKNSEMEKLRHTAVKALLEFHNLSHLALHNVFIGKDLMEALSLKTKLVYLDLKGCHFWENDTSMFSKLINLEHLDLRYVEHLDDYVFSDIVENCIELKYLNLERIYNIETKNHVSQLGNLRKLEYLNLKNTHVGKFMLSDIIKNLKNLSYLDINNCYELPKYLIDYLNKLMNLEYLNLENIQDLNTKSVVALVNNCRNLKTLKILLSNNVSANAFKKIRNLKKLEHLQLDCITKKNEKALVIIANECKNIKYLLISASSRATVASPVELGNLIKLETLILNNFNEVPPEIFKKLDRLKHLDFSLCKNVTDSVAAYVIDNCQNLTYLCCSETGISIDFLNYTVEKFKYRTNNNILIIHVDESLYEDFDEKENYSSGLRVMQDYL
ncbi:hypothetical protein HCN44_001183 [Aphidius gifuensis]|uniref:Disease resistance R13L4/SHOC-2-like LRR domain-containing protein n=1 Tax=Aphidius gifuensis TaxID=684658 RepID=A0A835CPZ5_APHGI|nr:hypothetical protein HCN44_001183 [Aphidius gifuensis]